MSDVKAAGYTLAVKWTDTLYMATDRTTVRPFVRPTHSWPTTAAYRAATGYKQVVASSDRAAAMKSWENFPGYSSLTSPCAVSYSYGEVRLTLVATTVAAMPVTAI